MVALVTSELVTNAVLHASPPIEIAVDTNGEYTRVEVWDGSPEVSASPGRRNASDDIGGWGLALIARLSETWGTSRTSASKCVWSEINDGLS
jgi:anti-sigma regulatory factor (Ser/Thr protein kinase)